MSDPVQPAFDSSGAGQEVVDIHKPFTTSERIQQLSEIDNDIASLLGHASGALKCIVKVPEHDLEHEKHDENENEDAAAAAATEVALSEFKEAETQFINTLDRVDKLLKRQIYALEEARIITLRSASDQQLIETAGAGTTGRVKIIPARLEPDGMGRYGQIDTGRLNMTSNTVERDMEGELWKSTTEHLSRAVHVKQEISGDDDRMQE
ncbi:mediator complex protein-domain-containing protein [Podospora didyma]|uniref:Mediator of RNA polymerase II transcription subunit 11 n=1 Tax=Podospora didyma TaxID=330526 RepID=A0AAE0N4Q3_9PEZI|nr:mediator complex protein-domain-containing protein [Podospora didyma]